MTSFRLRTVLAFSLSVFALVGLSGCAADSSSDDEADAPAEEQDLKGLVLDESSNGTTVEVQLGRSFTIALKDRAASSGYQWQITSQDAALGAPKACYLAPAGIGGLGTNKFAWKTAGSSQNLTGKHKLTFELRRSWEKNGPAAGSFSVTVNITAIGGSAS